MENSDAEKKSLSPGVIHVINAITVLILTIAYKSALGISLQPQELPPITIILLLLVVVAIGTSAFYLYEHPPSKPRIFGTFLLLISGFFAGFWLSFQLPSYWWIIPTIIVCLVMEAITFSNVLKISLDRQFI